MVKKVIFDFRNDWTKTSYMRAIDFWVILCYSGMFTALMEYIVILHLTQVDIPDNQEGHQRLKVSNRFETAAKFILPFYNIVFPIIYFMVCMPNHF